MFRFTPGSKEQQEKITTKAPVSSKDDGSAKENPYVEKRVEEIEAQRTAFLKKNPEFDMKAEMENPDFVNYVWGKGITVEEAYILTHFDELLEKAKEETMEELAKRRDRIAENGASKNRPAILKKNPKDLSDKEIDAIIERVRNGEKITF